MHIERATGELGFCLAAPQIIRIVQNVCYKEHLLVSHCILGGATITDQNHQNGKWILKMSKKSFRWDNMESNISNNDL